VGFSNYESLHRLIKEGEKAFRRFYDPNEALRALENNYCGPEIWIISLNQNILIRAEHSQYKYVPYKNRREMWKEGRKCIKCHIVIR